MAVIPSASRIDRAQFSGQQGVVQMPVVDNGLKSFGDSVGGVARDIKTVELADRQGVLDEADIASTIELERIKRKYENDPDFGTVGERSTAELDEALGKIGSGITNEQDRTGWASAQRISKQKVTGYLGKAVQVKQRDFNRASIDDQTEDLRKAALTSADPGEIRAMYERRLESAYARGDITAQERETMAGNFQGTITMDRLQRMDPDDLTSALQDPGITEYLNPDQMLTLELKAEKETNYNKATSVVDTELSREGSTDESMNAAVDAIKDPKVRRQAEEISRAEMSARRSAKTETATASYSKLDQMVRDDVSLQDIENSLEWTTMTPGQKNSITNLATANGTGTNRTVNNDAVHAEASRLAENKEWRQLDNLLNDYGDQLKDTTRDKYRTAASDGKAPEDVKYSIMVDSAIPGVKMTDNRNAVKVKIADWYDDFKGSMDREPTRAEVQAEIDVYTKKGVEAGMLWGTNETDPTYGENDDASMQQHKTIREAEMRADDESAYLRAVNQAGEGADQFTMAREFSNQKILQGYANLKNPESAALWDKIVSDAANAANISGKPVTSQEMIDIYETQRNKVMFE